MNPTEETIRMIAATLDHPSLFMGGPSQQSANKARRIVALMQDIGWTPPLADPVPSPVVAASVAEAGL